MRSNKKYKGKYTKKRLKNKARGSAPWDFKGAKSSWYYERFIAHRWYICDKITYGQFKQWGYSDAITE